MPTTISKPIIWLKTRDQCRKHFNDNELRNLGESLKVKQLQPPVCLRDGTIVCGERRFRAAQLVGMTHLLVTVIEEDLSETQIKVYQLVENMQREDLTSPEKTQGIAELKRLNPTWKNVDVAEHLKIDPASVTRLLAVFDCVAPVKEAYFAGQINGAVYAISRMPQEQQSEALAMALSGATRDQLESHRKKIRKGKSPAVHVQRLRCPLPSGVTVQFSGDGITLETALSAMIDLTKELKRAIDNNLNASTVEKVLKDKAKATA